MVSSSEATLLYENTVITPRTYTSCNPSFFPLLTPLLNMTRCPKPTYPWAPPSITVNGSVRASHGHLATCYPANMCPEAGALGYVYIIEDIPSLGHMMMSFTSLFSWLVGLSLRKIPLQVKVMWGSEANTPHSSSTVRDAFFLPMLDTFATFFRSCCRVNLTMQDRMKPSREICYRTKSCALRHCLMGRITPALAGASGHCASWFSSPAAVGVWRTMLHDQLEIPLPVHNCRLGKLKWAQVLIYARPAGINRAWKNPQRLAVKVQRYLSSAWGGIGVLVQVHYHKEQSWASQCRLFSQYDLIIGVHGAGLTNLICARPCAMIIEVGWTEYSFITILASHIGIHHCFANVSTTAWLTDGEGTGHPLFVSASIEPANITSCLDQFVGIHHPAPH
jgi:hypothetical protein